MSKPKFQPVDSQKQIEPQKPPIAEKKDQLQPTANEKKDMAEYDAYIKELYKVIDKIENQSPKPNKDLLQNDNDQDEEEQPEPNEDPDDQD